MLIHPKRLALNKIRTAQTVEEVLSLALEFLECEWGQKLKAQEAKNVIQIIEAKFSSLNTTDEYMELISAIQRSSKVSDTVKGITFLRFRSLRSFQNLDIRNSMVLSHDDVDDRTPRQKAEDELIEKIIPEISAENAERVLTNIFQSMVTMNFTIREAVEGRDIISSKITKGSIDATFLKAKFSDEIFWRAFSRKPANDPRCEPS